jgi:hypothetical protein
MTGSRSTAARRVGTGLTSTLRRTAVTTAAGRGRWPRT